MPIQINAEEICIQTVFGQKDLMISSACYFSPETKSVSGMIRLQQLFKPAPDRPLKEEEELAFSPSVSMVFLDVDSIDRLFSSVCLVKARMEQTIKDIEENGGTPRSMIERVREAIKNQDLSPEQEEKLLDEANRADVESMVLLSIGKKSL